MSHRKSFILAVFFYAVFMLVVMMSKIGVVYGEIVWTVYSYPFNQVVFISSNGRNAIHCETGFIKKDHYFLTANGSIIENKAVLLVAIQRKIDQGKYIKDGCK